MLERLIDMKKPRRDKVIIDPMENYLDELAKLAETLEKLHIRFDIKDFDTGHIVAYRWKDKKAFSLYLNSGDIINANKKLSFKGHDNFVLYLTNKLPT